MLVNDVPCCGIVQLLMNCVQFVALERWDAAAAGKAGFVGKGSHG
jgi:hypothetical protein